MAAQDLCTLDDVRLFLGYDDGSNVDENGKISDLITPASDAIINEVGRELAPVTTDDIRRFRVDISRRLQSGVILLSLAPYDLAAATEVVLNPETAAPTTLLPLADYELDPQPSKYGVYTILRLTPALAFSSSTTSVWGYAYIDITGAWGFPQVPDVAKQACVMTVAAWMDKGMAALAYPRQPDGGAAPTLMQVAPTFAIPDPARRLLWPLYRQRVF